MDIQPTFDLTVSQNRYLSPADDEMHAVLTVTAEGGNVTDAPPEAAEVIIIDCSGSMGGPPTKIAAAKRATRAAIDVLRDGALFAVIAGTHEAHQVFPRSGGLLAATRESRLAARDAVAHLDASGGTVIGEWLSLARRLLAAHPTAVRHVILLTDGKNGQQPKELDRELTACAEVFTCDARGIGADWDARELLRIAAALHGSADAVRRPADLAADFAAMTRTAMGKLVPEVRILVQPTLFAQVDFLRQTYPAEADLAGLPVAERTTAFPTGSWAAESREYHLRLGVNPVNAELDHDRDIRIARVDLELRPPGSTQFERTGEPVLVFAHWTDDLKRSSIMHPKVAHYTNQTELSQAVLRGCEAHDRGELATAEREWGRAVALAAQLGNDKVLTRLLRLVDVVGEAAAGVVRIKGSVRPEDLLSAAVGSVSSSMSGDAEPATRRAGSDPADPSTPDIDCPACHRSWPASSAFCGACGHHLDTGDRNREGS